MLPGFRKGTRAGELKCDTVRVYSCMKDCMYYRGRTKRREGGRERAGKLSVGSIKHVMPWASIKMAEIKQGKMLRASMSPGFET